MSPMGSGVSPFGMLVSPTDGRVCRKWYATLEGTTTTSAKGQDRRAVGIRWQSEHGRTAFRGAAECVVDSQRVQSPSCSVYYFAS